jgi:hypothetical protein
VTVKTVPKKIIPNDTPPIMLATVKEPLALIRSPTSPAVKLSVDIDKRPKRNMAANDIQKPT